MFERPGSGTRAVLVHVDFRSENSLEKESLAELRELASSAGVAVAAIITGARKAPDSHYFVGSGKAEEIRECVEQQAADVVLFNHALSPAQERNLEKFLGCRVVDRTGLILDIFAQRASTFEGKLQVELAQLKHLSTRLVRGWTHLERQKGGIGLRGPGETQLETDRRLIGERIKKLNRLLDKVRRQRDLRRKSRRKAALKTISLVGYTNVGKSTLFNRLTNASAYAADQLFATLDPTLRKLELPGVGHVILADTVGFIRHLPHNLVAAFRATLEETAEANLLLHVVDANDPNHHACIEQVNEVLKEIGADTVHLLEVYNKIDQLPHTKPHIDRSEDGRARRVWLSAETGEGLSLLQQVLTEYFLAVPADLDLGDSQDSVQSPARHQPDEAPHRIRLLQAAGRLRAKLYEWGVVLDEAINENGEWLLDIIAGYELLGYLAEQQGCFIDGDPDLDAVSNA